MKSVQTVRYGCIAHYAIPVAHHLALIVAITLVYVTKLRAELLTYKPRTLTVSGIDLAFGLLHSG